MVTIRVYDERSAQLRPQRTLRSGSVHGARAWCRNYHVVDADIVNDGEIVVVVAAGEEAYVSPEIGRTA